MCKVYNTIGSLATIKTRLTQNKIDGFNSVGELISFKEDYATSRQQIISNHGIVITEERNKLSSEVLVLENEISKSKSEVEQRLKLELGILRRKSDELIQMEKTFLQEFLYSFKIVYLDLMVKYKEYTFNKTVSSAILSKATILTDKNNRLQYLNANFEEVVKQSTRLALLELDRKRRVVEGINSFIYGAIGEQKVVKELEKLSDEYILINDFSISFTKPIYYPQAKQYIKSVQIDHLLISGSGIFLIETKNWSKDSLNNESLRSPVEQIKRANFALYKKLTSNPDLHLAKHHWGERKIPIRNLVVIINHRPDVDFEHVKVVTLNELFGYVEFFKPSLSDQETQKVADYVIKLSTRN